MTRPPFPASHLRLKRAYEPVEPNDGVRILVDRLWPRGLSNAEAALNEWVYSAHDEKHNDAIVLKDVLLEGMRRAQDG